jgi:hypothetical protein
VSLDETFEQLSWLEQDQNPFGLRVLDCRPFCTTMISTTKDPKIALSFNRLRGSTGVEHRAQHPADPVTVPCLLSYPFRAESTDGRLFVAGQMEDKWDIYLHDGTLFFARSWTGDLVYRAAIEFRGGEAVVTAAEASRSRVGDDLTLAVRVVDFLVKSHLYRKEVPHPLPHGLLDDKKTIAVYSFSEYGRWGSYACFEDTTTAKPAQGR